MAPLGLRVAHASCPWMSNRSVRYPLGAVLLGAAVPTDALAPLGNAERVRIGLLYTDTPSVRTRRDKVPPTPPHRLIDNAPHQCCQPRTRRFAALATRGVASRVMDSWTESVICMGWHCSDLYEVTVLTNLVFVTPLACTDGTRVR